MKTGYLLLVSVLCGALAGLLPVAGRAADEGVPVIKNNESAQPPPAPTSTVQQNVEAKPSQLSAGLDDIVKLSKAQVEEPVILSFIKSSEVPYQPSAQEVIKLRELGVSSMAVAALLHRGEELRQRAAEMQKQHAQLAPAPAPQVASPPEPTPVYGTSPAAYSVSSPNLVYVPNSDYGSYYYPSYYGYYGGYYPGFSIGFGFGGCYPYYGYGCYPYYGYGCYPYYGSCHGSYHVGSYGSYHTGNGTGYKTGNGSGYTSASGARGTYQAGYTGATRGAYQPGFNGGARMVSQAGFSGGSRGSYQAGFSGGGTARGGGFSGGRGR
jgi:hypothetical protein